MRHIIDLENVLDALEVNRTDKDNFTVAFGVPWNVVEACQEDIGRVYADSFKGDGIDMAYFIEHLLKYLIKQDLTEVERFVIIVKSVETVITAINSRVSPEIDFLSDLLSQLSNEDDE